MGKKKTFEEFKEEVYELVKDEYTLLSTEYVNNKTKVKMKHNSCDYEYEVAPHDFLSGKRCPKCSGKMKKTTDGFKEEVYNLVGNEYSLLSEYINCFYKVKFLHTDCNNEFKMRPNDFLKGQRCPYCAEHRFFRKTNDEFKEEVYNLVGNEYSLLSEYKNRNSEITFFHDKCKREFKMIPKNFIAGNRCPLCSKRKKKTNEEFKKEVYDLVKDEYSLLSEYKNANTKVSIKHNKCGNTYEVKPYHFQQGRRCPYCKSSKGEERIRKYLNENDIFFLEQYSFPDCKYKLPLKFDFYLEDDSGKIILIEYDGEQHFRGYFIYDKGEFNQQQIRDKIKDDYCDNHDNIDLYRISYKEFNNIETILNDIINKYE